MPDNNTRRKGCGMSEQPGEPRHRGRVKYPWLMQIIMTVLAAAWLVWFVWFANNPEDVIVSSIASHKTGWLHISEEPYNWYVYISAGAVSVGIIGAVVLMITPVWVWMRRLRRKPEGLFCSRCHKDMRQDKAVIFHADVLVCTDCAKSMADIGEKDFIELVRNGSGA